MSNRILLVDDEEGIRKVLGLSLEDSGYQVLTAANGEEALELFRAERPRIVLTDIKMPVMDGIELLRRVKEEDPEAVVIMLTGHGDMELAIRSLQHEAADFITKPINEDALGVALKRARERIRMQTQLREHTEDLERLVAEKSAQLVRAERMAAIGQTVAGLAHAIKNIIGGLQGGMYVLEKGIELDNRKYLGQGWEMIKGNVGKIKNLALDLLNYAKEREPDYQLCDPNDPAREVYGLMLPRATDCGIRLRLELAEGLEPVWLDPEGIHCCLLNLVTNALDACMAIGYASESHEVVLRALPCEGWAVEYQVSDNGCGMDAETLQKVFRTFFSTKGSKGTGLGLMITEKCIREHGGTIELESEKGKGTIFRVRLPRREARPDERPEMGTAAGLSRG